MSFMEIYKCKSKIFKLKPNFVSSDKLISTSSKKIFDCCVVPNETTYTEYDSPNITYVIICNRCSLQYVPETVQKLNKRFNWKRTGLSNLINMASVAFYPIICTKMSIVTLLIWSKYWKKLQRNGRTDRNASDGFLTSRRRQHEKTSILKLRTVYRYDFNYCQGDEHKKRIFMCLW